MDDTAKEPQVQDEGEEREEEGAVFHDIKDDPEAESDQ